jgi:hypothetical protein
MIAIELQDKFAVIFQLVVLVFFLDASLDCSSGLPAPFEPSVL